MMLTTVQAADILGVSKDKIKTFIEKGLLKDYRERKEGAKKHYSKLNQKEVREFAKSDEFKVLKVSRYIKNGQGDKIIASIKPAPAPVAQGIMTRLDAIESKLDTLLKIWS